MLLPRRIPDELDLADALIPERFQDRRPALDDLPHLLADHETPGPEALRILLELPSDERAADLSVGCDVRAERIELSRRDVDDLLRNTRKIGGLLRESDELAGVLRTEHLHAEPVVEAALLGGLHDRRIPDLSRGRLRIVQREGLGDRDPQVVRVRV